MTLRKIAPALLAAAAATALSLPAQAQTEIQWWHSMSGQLGEWVNGLAADFNAKQKDYKVTPPSRAPTRNLSPPPSRLSALATRRTSCRSLKSAPPA